MPTALITGASGGIGSAIAEALAATHTLMLAGRPSARLDAIVELLGAATVPVDLTDTDAITAVAGTIRELDVLVHDAGVLFPGYVSESTAAEWRSSFEVNVVGAVALTLALLPALHRGEGRVVFVNSGSGQHVSSRLASYSASKFALRAFADSLRDDEPTLRVTTVYPGQTDTAMLRARVAFEGGEYHPDRYLRPQSVARVIADVVSAPVDAHIHEVVVRPR